MMTSPRISGPSSVSRRARTAPAKRLSVELGVASLRPAPAMGYPGPLLTPLCSHPCLYTASPLLPRHTDESEARRFGLSLSAFYAGESGPPPPAVGSAQCCLLDLSSGEFLPPCALRPLVWHSAVRPSAPPSRSCLRACAAARVCDPSPFACTFADLC